jgi:hypothetical protein
VNSSEKNYCVKKPDCASVHALKVPEMKCQAGIMKVSELAEESSARRFNGEHAQQVACVALDTPLYKKRHAHLP